MEWLNSRKGKRVNLFLAPAGREQRTFDGTLTSIESDSIILDTNRWFNKAHITHIEDEEEEAGEDQGRRFVARVFEP